MNRWLSGRVFWPLTERALGRDTMRRLHELKRTQDVSVEEIRAVQCHKLRTLLRIAAEQTPYHARRLRDAGIDPMNPKLDTGVLPHLPILDRSEIREHLSHLTWQTCPGGAKPYATGGSSGEPLKFYFDRRRQSADWATRWRARGWWDLRPGDREVMLWGAPVELKAQDRLRRWRDRLLNQRLLSAFDMTPGAMDDYVELLGIYRPACLYGYPSSLAWLARHAEQRGHPAGTLGSPHLKAVFVTGEVLDSLDRTAIERAFAAPVVIEYGCRDGGLLGCECRHGRLHVPEENLIVEVLDGRGRHVQPGEVGEVVVTHLENHATLFIRYRTGDLARLGGRDCGCGQPSMTLLEVTGRRTDRIVTRTGQGLRQMHALALIYVLREAEGLRQFRITQRSLDLVEVEIVTGPAFTPEVEAAVAEGLRERLGSGVAVRILRRERIAPTASGKHACVVSEIADGLQRDGGLRQPDDGRAETVECECRLMDAHAEDAAATCTPC